MNNELWQLCEAVIEDRLTEEQRLRLEQRVKEDPEARRQYVEYVHQHAVLAWSAAEWDEEPVGRAVVARPSRPRRWLLAGATALAASLTLAVIAWYAQAMMAPPVATLAGGKSCKWDAGTLPTELGARLGPGRLRLAEGIARIVFDDGADVTLEAPADLEIVSARRCRLHAGRLVAKVPPRARGFVVDTPTAVMRDLGTEFGVYVRDAQTADLQVFEGRVDVEHRTTGRSESLTSGRNRRFGVATAADFDPQAENPPRLPLPPDTEQARVVQISTATGRGKDAYVQPLFPSVNSSDILLLVKNTVPPRSDYNRKAYIGLDLTPLAGMTILDAQLSFTVVPTGMGFASEVPDAIFSVYGLTDESLDDWEERTLRWSNAPANGPGGAGVDMAKVVLLGTFEVAQGVQGGTRSIGGPALVNFLKADTNGLATFILVRNTVGSGRGDLVHGFANKRHPSLPPPTLKVTAVPCD
ncbi:MAG: DNRLRE domain-containing protein [Gemmataceae bacterium]|nr:DNRLRE domain-containing protein [Gemmataceae bacterium]MDW8267093.1 DNRLRE domain-containing protein [Gemmataceae bacterium]